MFYMNFNFDNLMDCEKFASHLNRTEQARFTVVNINCVRHHAKDTFQYNILVDMEEPTPAEEIREEKAQAILKIIQDDLKQQEKEREYDNQY